MQDIDIQKINNIMDEIGLDIKTLRDYLSNKIQSDRDEEYKKQREENKKYVGNCYVKRHAPRSGMFPEMNRYYKVITHRIDNTARIECMIFDEHPTYWFDYRSHKAHQAGDYYAGTFDFCPIWVDDILICDLKKMQMVSQVEFNSALLKMSKEITELDWVEDHYRFGHKLPSYPDWRKT